jgi:cell filamentation protein
MDMSDVYCYPNSSVLKNRLDIHDKKCLLEAEIRLATIRLYQLQEQPVHGNFDLNHLCRIHGHIFQDLYPWAGKIRTVNIAKTNMFCLVQHIQTYAHTIFPSYYMDCIRVKDNPERFIHVFTSHYADLNALHPFREGNGHSQREFARELCLKCGYILDLTHTSHEEMLTGNIMSFDRGDNTGLEAVFRKCIIPLFGS